MMYPKRLIEKSNPKITIHRKSVCVRSTVPPQLTNYVSSPNIQAGFLLR